MMAVMAECSTDIEGVREKLNHMSVNAKSDIKVY
jgi:hypothetical protein